MKVWEIKITMFECPNRYFYDEDSPVYCDNRKNETDLCDEKSCPIKTEKLKENKSDE